MRQPPPQPRLISRIRSSLRRIGDRLGRRSAILLYHRIAEPGPLDPFHLCVSPNHFEQHLQVLRKRTSVLSLKTLAEDGKLRRAPRGAMVVTFDDGYADNHRIARPLLERYDVPASIFITTGYIGSQREFWWDQLHRLLLDEAPGSALLELELLGRTYRWDLADLPRRKRCHDELHGLLQPMIHEQRQAVLDNIARRLLGQTPPPRASHRVMDEHELLELSRSPLIEIGAHTRTHPLLPSHPPEVQREEIVGSVNWLTKRLNRPITSLTFPHGAYDASCLRAVWEAGVVRACTTEHRLVVRSDNPLTLPRFTIKDWDGQEFERRLAEWLG